MKQHAQKSVMEDMLRRPPPRSGIFDDPTIFYGNGAEVGAEKGWSRVKVDEGRDFATYEHRGKVPQGVWAMEAPHLNSMTFGVVYEDGTRETVGAFSPGDFRSAEEAERSVADAFAAKGIDVSRLKGWKHGAKAQQRTTEEEIRQRQREQEEAIRRMADRMWEDIWRQAAETPHGFGGGVGADEFRRRMREANQPDRPPAPRTPERTKALKRCRVFKDMISRASTNEGERNNAKAAMQRLMAKHEIAEREI